MINRTITFATILALTASPVSADEPLQGNVKQSDSPIYDERIRRDDMLPRILPPDGAGSVLWPPFTQSLGTATQVDLDAQHGRQKLGVLGVTVDSNTGIVQTVLPGSDLNNYQVAPGDQVIGFNGHMWVSGHALADESVGIPGTTFPVVFMHNGQVLPLNVKRVSAQRFLPYANNPETGYNRIRETAGQTKSW